jgi:hypothetical protein
LISPWLIIAARKPNKASFGALHQAVWLMFEVDIEASWVYCLCLKLFAGGFRMRRVAALLILASLAGLAPATEAESHNPADYPLRIHIFRRNETNFYHNRQTEESKGEGRANLFEGGTPKGIDFQFDCDKTLQTSSGYETFPAKWKKPGQELVILQPEFGKGSYDSCRLKVLVKDFAYFTHDGNLSTEPVAAFKQWMVKHDYDPEHGKDTPTPATSGGSGTSPQPQPH